MNTILEMLFTLTVAGSVATAFMLALRLIPTDIFPAKWRYGLGEMAVVFYLFPAALCISGFSWLFTSNSIFNLQHTQTMQFPEINPKPFVPEQTISANVAVLLLSIWAIGALGFMAWHMYCYKSFLKKLEHTRTAVPQNSEAGEQLPLIKKALGLKSNVQLAYSSIIRSPVLVGLWKPTIYLPMENLVNLNMDMVLQHELIHLKRKDLWVKMLTLGASALHWFNPLVHMIRKDIHTWSELSCDEEVVKGMSHADRKCYGETILNVMAGSRNVPAQFSSFLSGDGKHLKRRLTVMLNVKKSNKKTIFLTITTLVLVAVISTTAAIWASNNAPKVVDSVDAAEVYKKTSIGSEATPPEASQESTKDSVAASFEAPQQQVKESELVSVVPQEQVKDIEAVPSEAPLQPVRDIEAIPSEASTTVKDRDAASFEASQQRKRQIPLSVLQDRG
ncbi:M56 family metallopeptidase [Paenibacillus fonticola]|uniref:M56 family metallopeptidase n=1 Tax=Paenibacillus fonticola TaxID=379896 RepID=UPI00036F5663|nr:M56 family metallopeptidase [Paenibacillus fonticola]